METDSRRALRLRISKATKPKRFASVKEASEWLATEVEAWRPLTGNANPYGGNSAEAAAGQLIHRSLNNLQVAVDELAAASDGDYDGYQKQVEALFESAYSGILIASTSKEGRFILAQGGSAEMAARYFALTSADNLNIPPNQNLPGGLLKGLVDGLLFRNGLTSAASQKAQEELTDLAATHSNALSSLHADEQSRLADLHADEKERLDALHDEGRHALDLLTNSLRDATANVTVQQDSEKETFAVLLAEWQGRLDEWEDRLKQRLALEAPMDYWSNKAQAHGRKTFWFALTALVTGTGFGAAFVWLALSVLVGDDLTRGDYARIVVLVTVATLMMWTLRILVRVLLSELHLQSDASEREVILKTYTALDANEQSRLTDEDRRLLLTYVFRPASTGIVSDDSAPFGVAEILSRLGSK